MSDDKALVRRWLDVTGIGSAAAWDELAADDLVLRLPYAPPGVHRELAGSATARDELAKHWGGKERFDWVDVTIRATDEPGLYLTTARSEARLHGGIDYVNDYIILTRVRDGRIVEHVEYFNPLPVLAMIERLSPA